MRLLIKAWFRNGGGWPHCSLTAVNVAYVRDLDGKVSVLEAENAGQEGGGDRVEVPSKYRFCDIVPSSYILSEGCGSGPRPLQPLPHAHPLNFVAVLTVLFTIHIQVRQQLDRSRLPTLHDVIVIHCHCQAT